MKDQCKYCGAQELSRRDYPGIGWRLLETDGSTHHCAEFNAAKYSKQAPALPPRAPKKKGKHGAFLRWRGPKDARESAQLVETRMPPMDSPAQFYAELEDEPRKPAYYHLAQKAAR